MKNLKVKIVVLALILFTISSCSLQKGYVIYSKQNQDEIIATDAIKEHMKSHPKASIVLKVPNTEDKSTQAATNSYLYNEIEKELVLAGFDVKDRSLYNEVVGKSVEVDYAQIKKLTGTDLILELVRIENNVEYSTNKFFQKDGKEALSEDGDLKRPGGIIEFKLTLIEGNKFAGSFSFNYAPCEERTGDCFCEVAYKKMPSKVYPHLSFCGDPSPDSKKDKDEEVAYQYVSKDMMIDFVRNGVKKMIREMRK